MTYAHEYWVPTINNISDTITYEYFDSEGVLQWINDFYFDGENFKMKSYGPTRDIWYCTWYWKIDSAGNFLEWRDDYPKPDKWWQKLLLLGQKKVVVMRDGQEIQWGSEVVVPSTLKTSFRVDGLKSWTIPPLFAGLFDTTEQIVNFVKIHDTYTTCMGETYNDVLEILYQQTMNGKTGGARMFFVKGLGQVEFWWAAPEPTGKLIEAGPYAIKSLKTTAYK